MESEKAYKLYFFIIFVICPVCVLAVFGILRLMGNPHETVPFTMVVPGWGHADGIETARNIDQRLKRRWQPGSVCTALVLIGVRADGTMDLETEHAASLTMRCHDTALLATVTPGRDEVQEGGYSVTVEDGAIADWETEAYPDSIEPERNINRWPECSLADLSKSANEAGWPTDGHATVYWPDVPAELTKDGMESALGQVEQDREALLALLRSKEWDLEPYKAYRYFVPGAKDDSSPQFFDPVNCEAIDVWAIRQQAIADLRARCEACVGGTQE